MSEPIKLTTTDELLRVLIAVMGRVAIPEAQLRGIVSPRGSLKYAAAYNLCDGRHTQSEVARLTGLDRGNFSKAVANWVEAGIMFRIGEQQALLGLYPLLMGAMDTEEQVDAAASLGTKAALQVSLLTPGKTVGK